MKKEHNYEFREFLDQVHLKNRRDRSSVPKKNELSIDETWEIAISERADDLTTYAALDLQDYLFISMDISLTVHRYQNLKKLPRGKRIILSTKANPKKIGTDSRITCGYTLSCCKDKVAINGDTPRGTAQGVYYLEELMNLREAPYLEISKAPIKRKPLFSRRMIHSGWGIDQFPDTHLNAIAHAGFDTILVFVKGINRTTHGQMDFNNLITRADSFGLDVYFYSYLDSFKHPDETDADEFFERNFGSLLKHSPGAKGLILVGESCQFPSKDPKSNGCRSSYDNSENFGIADRHPAPGWWPCSDYPQWLNAVKKAVRRYQPDLDIVFWTYNWGRAPEKPRIDLIKSLPKDISLEVTFEMFEPIDFENYTAMSPDYSITFPGPGHYFSSEAEEAKKQGLNLYAMSNTGGMTWDMGVLPYIPTPQQWFKRYDELKKARKKWNLSGLMDSHHYGWWPSPVCECAKWSFWAPEVDLNEILFKIAVRDFGQDAAQLVVDGWQKWSDAIASYIPGFDDQAGPLRIGPAYPLVFHPCLYPHVEQKMVYPANPDAHFGARILRPMYNPEHIYGLTACGRRIREEIVILEDALKTWKTGDRLMDKALATTPRKKLELATKTVGVGKFFGCGLQTMLHVKRWWLLNKKLEIEYDFDKAIKIMDKMEKIVESETENVKKAIPLAKADSRLGWEPSMEYMADKWHLEWKIRQLENLRKNTMKAYRSTLMKNPSQFPFNTTN